MNHISFSFTIKSLCILVHLITLPSIAQDTDIASTYFNKADSLLTTRKPNSALTYFNKALTLYKQTNTPEQIAICHSKIATSYNNNYNFDQALQNAKKALAIQLDIYGDFHWKIASSYSQMGHIYKNQDKYQKAMEHYQKALMIQLKVLKAGDSKIGDSYHNIGTIHHTLAEYNQALQYYKKGLAIRISIFGKNIIK